MGSGGIGLQALDGGEYSAPRPVRFIPSEGALNIHCIKGWSDPSTRLYAVENVKISCLYRESKSNSSAIQPVAVSIPSELSRVYKLVKGSRSLHTNIRLFCLSLRNPEYS
jgi:hypothetical protein